MKLYYWTVESSDGFTDKTNALFKSQSDCYADMVRHAIDKIKWNTEWTDLVEANDKPNEDGLITNDKSNLLHIHYDLDIYPDKIVHKSYSGIYTYQIKTI